MDDSKAEVLDSILDWFDVSWADPVNGREATLSILVSLLFAGAGFVWGRGQERRKNAAVERAREEEDRARALRLVDETWAPLVGLLDVDKFQGIAGDLTVSFTNSVKKVPLHSRRPDWPLQWMPLYEWLSSALTHIELYRHWSSGMDFDEALTPVGAQQASLAKIKAELLAGRIGPEFFKAHRPEIDLACQELRVRISRQKEYVAVFSMMEHALLMFSTEHFGSFDRFVVDVHACRDAFERLQLTHTTDFAPQLQAMQSYLERIEQFAVASVYTTHEERRDFEKRFWPSGGARNWISG